MLQNQIIKFVSTKIKIYIIYLVFQSTKFVQSLE